MASPFMNLTIPVVGPSGTLGPQWAEDLNTDLDLLDQHDHSVGKGVKVTPAGFNVNQDFSMNSYLVTDIAQLAINNLSGTQPTAASRIYEYGGELYFNDGSANQVQLTSGGAINVAALGTITGDYSTSTADLTYVDATKTFIFKQSATVTANINSGPVTIYRNTAGSPYARIQQDASQSGNLVWSLPSSYPASTLPLKSSSAGVLSIAQILTADIADDQVTTVKIPDSNITTAKIANLNVTEGKIAAAAVTTTKIADANVTRAKLVAVGQQVSASCGAFGSNSASYVDVTNLTVTITTTGRPVVLMLQNDGSGNASYIALTGPNSGGVGFFQMFRDATSLGIDQMSTNNGIAPIIPVGAFNRIDVVAAGTYTYKVQVRTPSSPNTTVEVQYAKLVAFEL